jgi:hypothetical protein
MLYFQPIRCLCVCVCVYVSIGKYGTRTHHSPVISDIENLPPGQQLLVMVLIGCHFEFLRTDVEVKRHATVFFFYKFAMLFLHIR